MSITAWWDCLSKLMCKNSVKGLSLTILLAPMLLMYGCGGGGSTNGNATASPAITSTASTLASEGTPYSYTITATGPVNTAIAMVSGPDGAQISGSVLTWTPSHAQSRLTNAFVIKATTPAGASVSQNFSITPLGTIRGTAVDTYVTAAEGNVTGVEDLTKVYIGASVPIGSSWQTIEGVAKSDGTFEIQGVPAGNYWFATASGGYWTSASDLDLGQDFLGRKGGLLPATPTSLDLHLAGLVSWDSDDSINIFNANLGQTFDWSDNNNPGDTSTASQWNWTGPLSDASHGDAWYATQLGTKEAADSATWRFLERATSGILINQIDGATTALSGTLADAPQVTVHVKTLGSQFAALSSVVGLNAQVHSTTFGIYSEPFSAEKGWVGYAPTLLQKDGQEPIITDVDSGDVTFGSPFPNSWTPFTSLEYELTVGYKASGATNGVDVPAEIYVNSTQLPSTAKPLAPVITPVRNVKLGGSALDRSLATATLSPSLAWDAPATGTPTGYRVTVYQLSTLGTTSNYQAILDLFTKDTNMTIPDGVLLAGKEYFFGIRSYIVPGVDFTVAPYRAGFPWAHTDMLTPVVSTGGAVPSLRRSANSAIQHITRSALESAAPRAGQGPGSKAVHTGRLVR